MKRLRLLASSGLFIALTAFKLFSPVLADEMRKEIVHTVSRSDDYKKTVQVIGEKLFQKDDEKSNDPVDTKIYVPVSIDELRRETISKLPKNENIGREQKNTHNENVHTEKVQVFLENQKEFSDYAVPTNVSYDMPELPFAYTVPVAGCTSSGFGYRVHPILNEIKFHYGTDFAAQSGESIYAFAAGTIAVAEENDSFGKYVVIEHKNGYKSLYAHCGKIVVDKGDEVDMGQIIALVGATGAVTGPHLHFELTSSDVYLNPEFYF